MLSPETPPPPSVRPPVSAYLLQLVFGCGWRHSEDVVQFRVDDSRHGVAVDVAAARRWMDKETEPVENVFLASCLSFRKVGRSVRPLLPPGCGGAA